MPDAIQLREINGGVEFNLKVVPGSSRDQIVGPLDQALKLKVSAPAESGKANRAVCQLLASALNVNTSSIQIISGQTHANKRVRIQSLTASELSKCLNLRS